MSPSTPVTVEVTQAARDASASLYSNGGLKNEILAGECDEIGVVQAFAKTIAAETERACAILDKLATWEREQIATSTTQRERLCFANAADALERASVEIRNPIPKGQTNEG